MRAVVYLTTRPGAREIFNWAFPILFQRPHHFHPSLRHHTTVTNSLCLMINLTQQLQNSSSTNSLAGRISRLQITPPLIYEMDRTAGRAAFSSTELSQLQSTIVETQLYLTQLESVRSFSLTLTPVPVVSDMAPPPSSLLRAMRIGPLKSRTRGSNLSRFNLRWSKYWRCSMTPSP